MVKKNESSQEGEIIEIKEAQLPESKRIKLRIKERVSRRRKKRHLTLPVKIIAILAACLLGLYVGSKAVEKYFGYWKNPHLKYISEEESAAPQLERGEIFSTPQ